MKIIAIFSWELNCSIICQYANYLKEHGVQGILGK